MKFREASFGEVPTFGQFIIEQIGIKLAGQSLIKSNGAALSDEEVALLTVIKLPPRISLWFRPENNSIRSEEEISFSRINAIRLRPFSDGRHGAYHFRDEQLFILLEKD